MRKTRKAPSAMRQKGVPNVAVTSAMATVGSALAAAGATGAVFPVLIAAVAGGTIAYTMTNEMPDNGE